MKIRLLDFGGVAPMRAHANDAGADVCAPEALTVKPGEPVVVPLGFGLALPDGYAGYIFPRSSLSARGLVCELPPIDSGYRGQVHAILTNVGSEPYKIQKGDRIGQLVILPCLLPDFVTEEQEQRGQGAFGSTGV